VIGLRICKLTKQVSITSPFCHVLEVVLRCNPPTTSSSILYMLSSIAHLRSGRNVTHSIRAAVIHSNHRRAMMSALSSQPQRPAAHTSPKVTQPLKDSPPVVVPTAESLSSDAASPQVAARPPPVPKVERPRPTIRSTKAVLSMVCTDHNTLAVYFTHLL
jgi:hypothetical protein